MLIELTHAARRTDQKSQQAPPPFGDRTRRPRSPARKLAPKQASPCPNGHLNRSQRDRDPDMCPVPWELPRRILTTKEGAEQLSLLEACHLAGRETAQQKSQSHLRRYPSATRPCLDQKGALSGCRDSSSPSQSSPARVLGEPGESTVQTDHSASRFRSNRREERKTS